MFPVASLDRRDWGLLRTCRRLLDPARVTHSDPGGCGPVAMQQSDATDAENDSLAGGVSSAAPIKRREFYPLVQEICRVPMAVVDTSLPSALPSTLPPLAD
jgi:hypothetical protein